MLLTEAENKDLQDTLENTQSLRRSFTSILGGVSSFMAGANPILVAPLLKYFQIIEVLSNFGKINLEFRSNLAILFQVLEDMKLPEVEVLKKLGPI